MTGYLVLSSMDIHLPVAWNEIETTGWSANHIKVEAVLKMSLNEKRPDFLFR